MKMPKKQNICTLTVNGVTKTYDTLTAVNHVSFCATTGDVIALLGPNGAGKSTIMNMIAGYLSPTEGTILIKGNNTQLENISIKKTIGYLPEGAPMYADMTVRLFLQYMIALKLNLQETETTTKKQIQKLYNDEFERIVQTAKIENVLNQKIETLSKGFTRRTDFAQSIIGNPDIMLLDEPTDGLDPNQKEHMRALIKNMGKSKTIIISTHLLEEAETVANRIILINKGKITADGTLKDILIQTQKKTLAEAFKSLTTEEGTIWTA